MNSSGRDANARGAPPQARTEGLVLIGFCAFLFFYGLGNFGLLGADEPRYAQVAREMLARHDWITPTLMGKPWLEKPPLFYWQAALAYSAFGVSDWAARLPSAVDATLTVLAMFAFLWRFRPGLQLDGALIAASAAGVIAFARAASTDMPLAAMLTIALLAWYAWHESESRRYLAGFYLFLGLAALAKGPVAPFLAAVIIACFAVAKGDLRLLWRSLWLPGIALFAAVALPWYVAVQVKNPEFFRVFILEHNLARFGSNLYKHPEPFWYYIPVLLLGLVPWAVFFLVAFGTTIAHWWTKGREWVRSNGGLEVFLAIWLIVPVVFFSISRSKLPGYIVPAIPAGALLLAEYIGKRRTEGAVPNRGLIVLHSVVAVLPLIPALLLPYLLQSHRLPWTRVTALSGGFAAAVALVMIFILQSKAGFHAFRVVTLLPAMLALVVVLRAGAPSVDATLSARPVAGAVLRLETNPLPVAVLRLSRETEFGLNFYLDDSVARYEWGEAPKVEHVVIARAGERAYVDRWTNGRRVLYLGNFPPQHLEYYWVGAESAASK